MRDIGETLKELQEENTNIREDFNLMKSAMLEIERLIYDHDADEYEDHSTDLEYFIERLRVIVEDALDT